MNKNKKSLETAIQILIDTLTVFLVLGTAFFLRRVVLPEIYPYPFNEATADHFRNSLWIILVWIFFFYYEGLYTKRFSFWDEVKALWRVAFLSTVGSFVVVSLGKLSDLVPRTLIILAGILALPLSPLIRINMQRFLRKYGLFRRMAIIVGAGDLGRLILSALRRERNYGYHVIGFIDDNPDTRRLVDGVRVHRGIDRVERYIKCCRISDVFVAIPEIEKDKIQDLINRIQLKVERILFVPDLQSIPMLGTEIHHYFHDQIFSLEIKNNLTKTYNIFIKRLFDGAMSLLVLVILFLPMLALSLMIVLESPGSPLYTQTRIGRNGKPFKLYKFRTMYADSEEQLTKLLEEDEQAKRDWETFWKLKDDPRVTKIGNFLRKTSLDELPQLINVLRGEMSLVGPRPYLPEELGSVPAQKSVFLSVWPGITGLWQVNGRSNTDYNYRVALDVWYVRNWTLWLDVVILLKTARVVVMRDGAY